MLRSSIAAQHQNTNRSCTRHVTARIRSARGQIGDQPRLEPRFGFNARAAIQHHVPVWIDAEQPSRAYRGDSIAPTPRASAAARRPQRRVSQPTNLNHLRPSLRLYSILTLATVAVFWE
jgi:hypothetical protein